MQSKTSTKSFIKYLKGHDYKEEKRKIMIRAIEEEQIDFIRICKEKWGEEFYSEIVPNC